MHFKIFSERQFVILLSINFWGAGKLFFIDFMKYTHRFRLYLQILFPCLLGPLIMVLSIRTLLDRNHQAHYLDSSGALGSDYYGRRPTVAFSTDIAFSSRTPHCSCLRSPKRLSLSSPSNSSSISYQNIPQPASEGGHRRVPQVDPIPSRNFCKRNLGFGPYRRISCTL